MKYNFDVLEKIIHSPAEKFKNLFLNYQYFINKKKEICKDYNIVENINFNFFTSIELEDIAKDIII